MQSNRVLGVHRKLYNLHRKLLQAPEVDKLEVGVLVHAGLGALLADARGLVSAEGSLRGRDADVVDPHHPHLQLPRHAPNLTRYYRLEL